jgi:hypothetical protein
MKPALRERFGTFWTGEPNTGCWLWTGFANSDGYGYIGIAASKPAKAHRVSWELHRGQIPSGVLVCHKCDTPSCVNPDHLFLGTDADNSKDRNQKLRLAYGKRHGTAKLDDAKAKEIRTMIDDGISERDVASRFGVSRGTVRAIKSQKTWKPERLSV